MAYYDDEEKLSDDLDSGLNHLQSLKNEIDKHNKSKSTNKEMESADNADSISPDTTQDYYLQDKNPDIPSNNSPNTAQTAKAPYEPHQNTPTNTSPINESSGATSGTQGPSGSTGASSATEAAGSNATSAATSTGAAEASGAIASTGEAGASGVAGAAGGATAGTLGAIVAAIILIPILLIAIIGLCVTVASSPSSIFQLSYGVNTEPKEDEVYKEFYDGLIPEGKETPGFSNYSIVNSVISALKQLWNNLFHDGTVVKNETPSSLFDETYIAHKKLIDKQFKTALDYCVTRVTQLALLGGVDVDLSLESLAEQPSPFINVNYIDIISVANVAAIEDGQYTFTADGYEKLYNEADISKWIRIGTTEDTAEREVEVPEDLAPITDTTSYAATSSANRLKIELIPFYRIGLQKYTYRDLFEMFGLDPDAESTQYPNMTNYDVAEMYKHMMENTDATVDMGGDYHTEWTDSFEYVDISDLSSFDVNMSVPVYYQNDYPTTYFGTNTISKSGCAITCFAMVSSKFTGQAITPDYICANYSQQHSQGALFKSSLPPALCEDFGFNMNYNRAGFDAESLVSELEEGRVCIVKLGKGAYTTGTHYIVVCGIEDSEYFIVNDPNRNNYNKYGNRYPISEVCKSATFMYSFY